MISLYVLIFIFIFGFFAYNSNETNEVNGTNLNSSSSDDWRLLKEIWSSLGDRFSEIDIEQSIVEAGEGLGNSLDNISVARHLFSTSCIFTDKFKCLEFDPYKEGNYMIFKMKNVVGTNINLVKAEIKGGITCENTDEIKVSKGNWFYLKLENCVFEDVEATLELTYYGSKSSIEFSRIAVGEIIVK